MWTVLLYNPDTSSLAFANLSRTLSTNFLYFMLPVNEETIANKSHKNNTNLCQIFLFVYWWQKMTHTTLL